MSIVTDGVLKMVSDLFWTSDMRWPVCRKKKEEAAKKKEQKKILGKGRAKLSFSLFGGS